MNRDTTMHYSVLYTIPVTAQCTVAKILLFAAPYPFLQHGGYNPVE